MRKPTVTTVWTSVAVLTGICASFILIQGSLFIANNVSFGDFRFSLGNPFSDQVLVLEEGGPSVDKIIQDGTSYTKRYVVRGGQPFPDISSPTFLVGDAATGQIIASRKKDDVRAIASLTKLMTAVIADEELGLQEETIVSRQALSTYGQTGRLRQGQRLSLEELLYPLLLESSNDAAEVIAEHDNRFAFMQDMNTKTKAIGMENTYYDDASGLSSKNRSTVFDLFQLVQYIDKYRRYIFDITTRRTASARGQTWYNNSRFTGQNDYAGGKNGYTDEAGKTNIAVYELPLAGEDATARRIAIIVFDSDDPLRDTRAIVSYLRDYVYYE